jgi:hypothetical protein
MHAYMHEKGWQYQYLYLWLGSLQIYLLPDHSFCGPRTDLSTKLFFLDKGICSQAASDSCASPAPLAS